MIRTLVFISSFAIFTNLSSAMGTTLLAENGLLLRVVDLCLFVLQGLGTSTQTLTGNFKGKDANEQLKPLLEIALLTSLLLALPFALVSVLFPQTIFGLLTNHAEVTKSINSYVGWLIPVLVFAAIAIMLEGYFIGLTEGQTIRNSALAAFGIRFAPTAFVAWYFHSNHVLWLALSLYMVISVVTLGIQMQRLSLRRCVENIPTGLVQTSAFNVDDMVLTDILYRDLKPATNVPVIFLDTLYHFPQTLELVAKAKELYNLDLKLYKIPDVDSRSAFAAKYGEALWDSDVAKFHHLTKIEPLLRGLKELKTVAWITGRRRDQAVTRADMPVFESDNDGRLKVNPLANWTRKESWAYVFEHDVIYNPLHDQGYASIGEEPLTTAVGEGEDERAGRWRGTGKTECGIHI